ncbi:MAG: hypothetical protein ACI9KE_000553 [Polyangiales bacterium]|jgi:hypothetical protein
MTAPYQSQADSAGERPYYPNPRGADLNVSDSYMKQIFTLAFVLLIPTLVFALMPPHVTGVPDSGSSLVEHRIVKISGYSLGHGAEATVLDGEGQTVAVQQFLWTRSECRGRPGPCGNSGEPVAPGSEQVFGVLSVKLPVPSEGATFSVTLLGTTVHVDTRDGAYVIR